MRCNQLPTAASWRKEAAPRWAASMASCTRVGGVLGAAGGPAGQPVQPAVVATEQFLECVAVAGDVGGQQLGVAANDGRAEKAEHGRTVVAPGAPGHFTRA